MGDRVRITVEFEDPGHDLEECIKLVMLQMRATPKWPEGEQGGTGRLNYVCYDQSLRCVAAEIVSKQPA